MCGLSNVIGLQLPLALDHVTNWKGLGIAAQEHIYRAACSPLSPLAVAKQNKQTNIGNAMFSGQ